MPPDVRSFSASTVTVSFQRDLRTVFQSDRNDSPGYPFVFLTIVTFSRAPCPLNAMYKLERDDVIQHREREILYRQLRDCVCKVSLEDITQKRTVMRNTAKTLASIFLSEKMNGYGKKDATC